MVLRAGGPHDPAVWLADGATTFLGSGFFVAPGLVVTCAHVVHAVHTGRARGPVTAHGVLGPEEVLSVELWPPDRPAGSAYYPAPDLAVLRTPVREGRPVAVLAESEAPAGTELSAHGFTTATPADGVQPDTARLTVAGLSGGFVRLVNGWIRKGLSGSMVVAPGSGHVVGVVKGTEDDGDPVGGWMTPVGQLRALLDLPPARRPVARRAVSGPQEWADALFRIPAFDDVQNRHDLVRRINGALPADQGIRPRGDSLALPHLELIAGACLDNLAPCAALRALVEAVRRLAGGHRAVGDLEALLTASCGGGTHAEA